MRVKLRVLTRSLRIDFKDASSPSGVKDGVRGSVTSPKDCQVPNLDEDNSEPTSNGDQHNHLERWPTCKSG